MDLSFASNFTGPAGALVMSLIAMSIVFLVIAALMFLMMAMHKAADAVDRTHKGSASVGGR